jgi:quinohemoprotein ethanol dehydrogenase
LILPDNLTLSQAWMLDAASGELAWRFYTVPDDPAKPQESTALEMALKTWTGDEWYKTNNPGV